MSGPIVRTGTTPKFWENWDKAFGGGDDNGGAKKSAGKKKKAAVKKKTAAKKKSAAKKAAKKKASSKKAATKKAATRRSLRRRSQVNLVEPAVSARTHGFLGRQPIELRPMPDAGQFINSPRPG